MQQKQKIHPHKFTLWIAIGSIIMMFAGLTSAYIVKSGQANFTEVKTPQVFWYSTAAILLSSLTIQMALRSFKQREMNRYRQMMAVTMILGAVFIVLQWSGFMELWNSGIQIQRCCRSRTIFICDIRVACFACAGWSDSINSNADQSFL